MNSLQLLYSGERLKAAYLLEKMNFLRLFSRHYLFLRYPITDSLSNPFQMIALMLNDLCGPAGKLLNMLFYVKILVFQFNLTELLCLPCSG